MLKLETYEYVKPSYYTTVLYFHAKLKVLLNLCVLFIIVFIFVSFPSFVFCVFSFVAQNEKTKNKNISLKNISFLLSNRAYTEI